MAALPHDRTELTVPFANSGVDFAGPFQVKAAQLRTAPYLKAYVLKTMMFNTPVNKKKGEEDQDSSDSSQGTIKPNTRLSRKMNPHASAFINRSDELQDYCERFQRIDISTMSAALLKQKAQSLKAMWTSVQEAFNTVRSQDETTLPEGFSASAVNKYFACLDKQEITAANIQELIAIQEPPPQTRVTQPSVQGQPMTNGHCLTLPPCDTEVFHGGYEQWPSFRDLFTAVYINHPKLSPAQKLYHCNCKALEIIKQFELSDANFELAWEALRARFDNKRILIDNQIDLLMSIKKVSYESSEGLAKIQSTINNCLSALKSQGVDTTSWDPILLHICCSKLPQNTLALWEQSLSGSRELPKWSEMSKFLTSRFEVVERLNRVQPQTHQSHQPQKFPMNKTQNPSSHVNEQQGQKTCKMCKAPHHLRACKDFIALSPQDRLNLVREKKLCENCLSSWHTQAECSSKYTCTVCQRRHHSMLHIQTKPKVNKTSSQLATTQSDSPVTQELPCCSKYAATQALHASNNSQVLLPTAIITLMHENERFMLRALIDQGSQRTFLSAKIQNRLQIPYENSPFEISGMGGRVIQKSNKLCTLQILNPHADTTITTKAIVLPQLTIQKL